MKKADLPVKTLRPGVLIAEFVGAFSLAYAVLASINGSFAPSIPTGVIAGFTLLLAALSIGGISGAHINPAITIGLLSIKKISFRSAVLYLIAQFLGAITALGLVMLVLHGHGIGAKSNLSDWTIFSSEMIGAIIFSFGVSAAVEQGLEKINSAVLVGGSLTLGILFAGIASNGVVNPAVAVAINSSTWAYLFGPIVGAVIGMNLQHYMRKLA
jgi:glycerol uptake facilitator-like aquaporin